VSHVLESLKDLISTVDSVFAESPNSTSKHQMLIRHSVATAAFGGGQDVQYRDQKLESVSPSGNSKDELSTAPVFLGSLGSTYSSPTSNDDADIYRTLEGDREIK
jgi:hypothetical protein